MATVPRGDRSRGTDGARDRGPALGRRGVRRVPGAPRRAHRGPAAARRRHRPSRGRGAPPLLAARADAPRCSRCPRSPTRMSESLITQSLPEADPELIEDRARASRWLAALRRAARGDASRTGAADRRGRPRRDVDPSSVQALIAARIDALPPEPKRVLMEASVVGKTFWSGAVAASASIRTSRPRLAELVRREFCRPVHPSTMEGDLEFGFWHALVRDVAYAELTKAERARMHAATARWIADRTAGAMGEDAEIVVHHLDAALELAPSRRRSTPPELRAAGGCADRSGGGGDADRAAEGRPPPGARARTHRCRRPKAARGLGLAWAGADRDRRFARGQATIGRSGRLVPGTRRRSRCCRLWLCPCRSPCPGPGRTNGRSHCFRTPEDDGANARDRARFHPGGPGWVGSERQPPRSRSRADRRGDGNRGIAGRFTSTSAPARSGCHTSHAGRSREGPRTCVRWSKRG